MESKIKYLDASDGQSAIAKSLSTLCTAQQLGIIRNLSRKLNIDVNVTSQELFECNADMLSISGATDVIQNLSILLPEKSRGKILPFVKSINNSAILANQENDNSH